MFLTSSFLKRKIQTFTIKLIETMPLIYQLLVKLSQTGIYENGIFSFTEIANNHWLKRGTVTKNVRFISHFPVKLHMQFCKYFHSTFLCSVASDCIRNTGFL